MSIPPEDLRHLVRRVPLHQLPAKHRRWVGNDQNQRNVNGRVPVDENPVYMELCWTTRRGAPERLVGGFVINAKALVRQGYVAMDPSGDIRLKFLHGRDSVIYLGRGITKKRIPIG